MAPTIDPNTRRNFLHGFTTPRPVDHKRYQNQQSAVYNGHKITHFESFDKAVSPHHRHGVMVESPGQSIPMHVFGTYQEISSIAAQIKTDPEAVFRSLRPAQTSPTNTFYLNTPAPTTELVDPNVAPSDASLIYDHSTNQPDVLRSIPETEAAALQEHKEDTGTATPSGQMRTLL